MQKLTTMDFALHRTREDGVVATDAFIATLPPLPARIQAYRAMRAAQGFTDEDIEEDRKEPSGPRNDQDATAVAWATLALCWFSGKLAGMPTLREHNRDVVAFGEAALTVMWDAGYRDQHELSEVGARLFNWMLNETFGERGTAVKVAEAREGFPEAPEPEKSAGAH